MIYSALPFLIYPVLAFILIIPAAQTGNIELILHPPYIVAFVCWILSIRILIYGLSRFNKYTYGYAILNVLFLGVLFESISLSIKH